MIIKKIKSRLQEETPEHRAEIRRDCLQQQSRDDRIDAKLQELLSMMMAHDPGDAGCMIHNLANETYRSGGEFISGQSMKFMALAIEHDISPEEAVMRFKPDDYTAYTSDSMPSSMRAVLDIAGGHLITTIMNNLILTALDEIENGEEDGATDATEGGAQ